MTHIDLFSGIGGFALAAQWAGFETVAFVEIEPYAQEIIKQNFPGVPIFADIREFDGANIASPTLITGGFPCQPVSTIGHKRAQLDPRWLWPEFARVIRILRPQYIVVENTPGLLVRGFGDILRDLAENGYDAEWRLFSACELGAPHTRERVFVVAYAAREHGKVRLGNGTGEKSLSPRSNRSLQSNGWLEPFS